MKLFPAKPRWWYQIMLHRHSILVKNLPQTFKDWFRLYTGARAYKNTNKTPPKSYQSMIKLFCRTNGHSNDFVHGIIRKKRSPVDFSTLGSLFPDVSQNEIEFAADEMRNKGYFISPYVVPDSFCEQIIRFSKTQPASLYPVPENGNTDAIYNENQDDRSRAAMYSFHENTLLHQGFIQNLLSDRYLLSVAQSYLSCTPVNDAVSLWWSSATNSIPQTQRELAQQYHFDMDRIKWLKIFVYLTDVDENGGPHCYVEGTHKSGSHPLEIRKRGYDRIPDADLQTHYPEESFVELTGKKGTILFVDTRGFHKGKPPISRDRLVLMNSYCDSLFGGGWNSEEIDSMPSKNFSKSLKLAPQTYKRFNIQCS